MTKMICPKCHEEIDYPMGSVDQIRKESLSRGLIDALVKFKYAIINKGVNKVHLQRDVRFTKNEYNNFQKLRYHGLVHHAKDALGNKIPGFWIITKNGGSFLRNKISLRKWVLVADNHLLADQLCTEYVYIDSFYPPGMYSDEYWQTNFNVNIEQGVLI